MSLLLHHSFPFHAWIFHPFRADIFVFCMISLFLHIYLEGWIEAGKDRNIRSFSKVHNFKIFELMIYILVSITKNFFYS